MTTTWSSGTTLTSPSYGNDQKQEELRGKGFSFIDFLPQIRESGGFFSEPVYETFRALVDRANAWLQANPQWEIKTCESVEFKASGGDVDTETMTYLEYGTTVNSYIRGLRLWLLERPDKNGTGQQIGYMNLKPRQTSNGGIFSSPTYESLQEVIDRFNVMIQTNPIPGRIITIETREMKTKSSTDLDPDISNWRERGDIGYTKFLFVIRIFFEIVKGPSEEIGIVDFIPNTTKQGGIFSFPKYEPFSSVVEKASNWCTQQDRLRFCNAQSLEIKLKMGGDIDTQKMEYVEHGNRKTFYVRILRVTYTKAPSQEQKFMREPLSVRQLTCKTFVPVQLTSGFFVPKFETLNETRTRVSAWVKATGAQVFSAETAALRMFTGGEAKHGTEASFTYNREERSEYWIFVIRLYLNGKYEEPPPEMLP
ncbi:hypothetical protein X975_05027, partial [Stegodyphus mimosarum]